MTFKVGTYLNPGSIIRSSVKAKLEDLEAVHVIGAPGEGKSTFLGRMADSCIDEGEGVLLLDPKGDLAVDVATRTRHPGKLIYITPGGYQDRSFCLNVLEVPQDHPLKSKLQEIAGDNLMQMFNHMGSYDPDLMALIETYLRIAIKTAYTLPQPTLIDVMNILLKEEVRKAVVSRTRRPDIRDFWTVFDQRNTSERRHQVDSTLRRLWPYRLDTDTYYFVANPTSTLKLSEWLDAGCLVVVNLAHHLHENDSERIGNIIVSYLTTQYRYRASELFPVNQNRRWRLIVDEFWRFAANPYAQIIREGRSFNFFPVVAHQDMGQLNVKGKGWTIPSALGFASLLSFRRSRAATELPPGPVEEQRDFIERQRAMRQYEANWTYRGSADTSTKLLRMEEWKSTANPTALTEAVRQAHRYTLPYRTVIENAKRLEVWRQGGTMEENVTQASTRKPNQISADEPHPRSQSDPDQALSNEPDSARTRRDAPARPGGLLDAIARRQDLLLGSDDDSESKSPTPSENPTPGP